MSADKQSQVVQERRRRLIKELFKGRSGYTSDHKFDARTGRCAKCSMTFEEWITEGGTYMCGVICSSEFTQARHD